MYYVVVDGFKKNICNIYKKNKKGEVCCNNFLVYIYIKVRCLICIFWIFD